jgi:O-Antigen ligase
MLVIVIDILVVTLLVGITLKKGLESALPFLGFSLILLPIQSRIAVPGLFDFTSSRIAIITFTGLYLALGAKGGRAESGQGNPLKVLMLLTIGWGLISTANSVVFTTSLKTVLSEIFEYYLPYYLFFRIITTRDTVHKILKAMVAAMVVCCFCGYLEIQIGWSVLSLLPATVSRTGLVIEGSMIDFERGLRARSLFPHPILFGTALALGIPLTLYLLSIAEKRMQKAYLWLAVMAMFWCVYKTMSRGPWLAVVISLALLPMFSSPRTRKHLLVILLLAVSVLMTRPGVRETIQNQYLATLNLDTAEGQSYKGRWDLLRMSREVVSRDFGREIWGYGPESFFYLGLTGENGEGHIVPFTSCDSSWFEAIAEIGYVGLLLLAALFMKALVMTFRSFRAMPRPSRDLCGVLFVSQVTFIFMMTNVACYGWGQQSSMSSILIGLAMACPRVALNKNVARPEIASLPADSLEPTCTEDSLPRNVVALINSCNLDEVR